MLYNIYGFKYIIVLYLDFFLAWISLWYLSLAVISFFYMKGVIEFLDNHHNGKKNV